MVEFSAVTSDDIKSILDNLWDRGEEEAFLFGLKNRDEMAAYLTGAAKKHGYCLKSKGVPVAAFGAERKEPDKYVTWFIATDRFTEEALGITRFLRGFIKDKLASRPDAKMELVSAVGHPDAERWFNVLGFRHMPERRQGLFRTYIYERPIKQG